MGFWCTVYVCKCACTCEVYYVFYEYVLCALVCVNGHTIAQSSAHVHVLYMGSCFTLVRQSCLCMYMYITLQW